MASTNKDESTSNATPSKRPLWTTGAVLGLSLSTWVFFYTKSMQLTAADTVVVVGFWLAIVLLSNWIWKRLRRKK